MKNAYLRNTIICVAVHVACVYVLIAVSLCSCHSRRPPKDLAFFVDFQPGPPPPPSAAAQAAESESAKTEPAPPEPVDVPEPIPEPSKTELPKTKKTPAETSKKPKVEVSTNIVRRAAAPAAKRPVKKLSAAQIRNMLGTAAASANAPAGSPAIDGATSFAGMPGGVYGAGSGSGSGVATPYGWYLAQVRAVMYDAWAQPSALAGTRGLVTRVMVRVRQDGQIIRKEMVDASGNNLMDTTVMTAVESVNSLPELPFGFGGAYKDITIDFELEDIGP